jgi:Protein of unknown function (DUF3105)
VRRPLVALAVGLLAAALCAVLVVVLAGRDASAVQPAAGPGVLEPDRGAQHLGAGAPRAPASGPSAPPTSGPHRVVAVTRDRAELSDDQLLSALELGNVVLAYADPRPPAALVQLQRAVAGPFDRDLVAAGQAMILDRRPGVRGVIALAWRRRLDVASAKDPQLRPFAEAWLGQGPG